MKSVSLQASKRDVFGKKNVFIREKGLVPAVVYGSGSESRSITVPLGLFEKAYKQAGASTLVDLIIDEGAPVKTLIHEVQYDPVSDHVVHVDFFEVKMTEKLTATVPLKFTGEPKAVKELGGTLVKNMDEVEIHCLPGDLLSEIEVDLTKLKTFDDTITLADLPIPKEVELLGQMETIIATVTPSLSDEDVKKMEEDGAAADISGIEKVEEKTKEDAEKAE